MDDERMATPLLNALQEKFSPFYKENVLFKIPSGALRAS
jgi:hypothetical protein